MSHQDTSAPNNVATDLPGSRVVKNSMIYIAGQLISWVVAFVSVSLIPRKLEEIGMGQMTVAGAAVNTVAFIATFSIEQYLTPAVARDKGSSGRLLRATLGFRIVCIPFMLMVATIALAIMHASQTVWILGAIYATLQTVLYLYTPCRNVLVGWEEARTVAICDLGQVCAPLFAIPALPFGVVPYVTVWALANLPVMFWAMWSVQKRVGGLWPAFDVSLWRQIVRASLDFMINDWTSPLLLFTTVYLLKRYGGGEAAVGVYSQAQRLLGTFLFVPTAIGSALLPSLTRLAETDYEAFRRLQTRITLVMIVAGLPLLVFAIMLADPFCHLLYGTKFQALPVALRCCGASVIPLYVTIILYRFLVAERKNAMWSRFMIFTLLLNAILCSVLIPFMKDMPGIRSAAAGAALSFAIAETTSMIGAFIFLKVSLLDASTAGRLARALIAASAMTGVIWLTGDIFFILRGILGLAVFMILAWQFRVLGAEDQEKLWGLIRRKLPFIKK